MTIEFTTRPYGAYPVQAAGSIERHGQRRLWCFRARSCVEIAVAAPGHSPVCTMLGSARGHVWTSPDGWRCDCGGDPCSVYSGYMRLDCAERHALAALGTYPDGPGWEEVTP